MPHERGGKRGRFDEDEEVDYLVQGIRHTHLSQGTRYAKRNMPSDAFDGGQARMRISTANKNDPYNDRVQNLIDKANEGGVQILTKDDIDLFLEIADKSVLSETQIKTLINMSTPDFAHKKRMFGHTKFITNKGDVYFPRELSTR